MVSLYYLNPLASALIFAFATILLKRGLDEGSGATRSVFVTNATFFFGLLPLWWIFPDPYPRELLWAPAAAGVAAFSGSLFQVLALKLGDVSVATPLLGSKVLFVALFSTLLLGNVLPLSWWAGAVLAGLGIFFLGSNRRLPQSADRLARTVLLSLCSVSSFALMDVAVAGWGKAFGFQRFVVLQMAVTFGLTLFLIPFFSQPLHRVSRRCWTFLISGSLLIVLQFYLLNWTIAMLGEPTVINILYSSRGLWSVVLVWTIGPLFGNRESGLGGRVLRYRIIGAGLLFSSIFLVFAEDLFPL